jgi:hypothetical protein
MIVFKYGWAVTRRLEPEKVEKALERASGAIGR